MNLAKVGLKYNRNIEIKITQSYLCWVINEYKSFQEITLTNKQKKGTFTEKGD